MDDSILKVVRQLVEAIGHPPNVEPFILTARLQLLFVLEVFDLPLRFVLILCLVLVITRGLSIVNEVDGYEH